MNILRKINNYFWYLKTKSIKNNLKLKRVILFESIPDISDNSRAVFLEMLKRKINKKYKLVWIVSQNCAFPKIKNVLYINYNDSRYEYYNKVAKVKITCNYFLNKSSFKQFCFYLSHGTALKVLRTHYTVPPWMDYCLVASDGVLSSQSYEFNFPQEKMVSLGFPRNDELTRDNNINLQTLLGTNCKKVIVWYPTFRQHKDGTTVGKTKNAIPIIYDEHTAKQLNKWAKEKDVLLVLKPHFAQNTSYIKDLGLSNIRFIDDSFFAINKLSSYQFVGACDALLTDYSSIYFDYTLANKPIGLILEDIEAYKEKYGLVDYFEEWTKGGEKIYTLEELFAFIERISGGIDLLKIEREKIRDFLNISTDGKNSERVVDFIIEKAKLKV